MIHNKDLWHFIFDVVKYSDYEMITAKQDPDIILSSKKTKEVMRFITEKQNIQSTQFLIEKMKDHKDELNRIFGFTPAKIKIFLINQEPDIQLHSDEYDVVSINHKNELQQLKISNAFHWFGMKQGNQSESYYKKRVYNNSFIDRAMIKFAPITTSLLVINILVYILNSFLGNQWIERGALTHFNFVHGDIYRIVTAMFLHFDFSHILFNMMSLYIFGKLIEYLYGRKMLVIYLIAGLFGNLLSLAFDTVSTSVGASGAITGLMGALVAYFAFSGKFERKFIIQMSLAMLIFLLISNLFAEVNNWAHFGGLFAGFYVASALFISKEKKTYLYYLIAGGVLIAGLLLYLIYSQPENHIYNMQAETAMEEGNFKKANQILKEIFDYGYENDETYILYGTVRAEETSLDDAIEIWKKGLKAYPHSSQLNYQMALAMRAKDDYKKASIYLNSAKQNGRSKLFELLEKELEVFNK